MMNYTQQAIWNLSRQVMEIEPDLSLSELDRIVAMLIPIADSELSDRIQDLLNQSVIAEFLGSEVKQ